MEKRNWIYPVIGIVLISLALFFLRDPTLVNLKYFVVIILVVLMFLPLVLSNTLVSKKQKEKESKFLEFVRDLVENVKSGTPISRAILNVQNRDYGALSSYVKKLANQIAMGIPLTSALSNFARDTRSPVVARAVDLISEAERSGGEIVSILTSVSSSVNQTEKLKKEQKSSVYNLVVQGYIIFIVFILIIIVLQHFILPLTKDLGGGQLTDLNTNIVVNDNTNFEVPLLIMLVVQSLFAGLVIGKISEGSIRDGIKHSFILTALALITSFGAGLLIGGSGG